MQNLLVVELNEFNPDFLEAASARLGLRNIQNVLRWPRATTTTEDRTEHHGLDPWVQWVNVHAGQPSRQHGVRRLGDTSRQTAPQVWHRVAEAGGTWGVWGAMNAPLGDAAGCAFFMPDPWSFDEVAAPAYLNDLLALPRYVSKNYLEVDYLAASRHALRLVRFFLPPAQWGIAVRFAERMLSSSLKAGVSVHTFTTLLDFLGVLCFNELRRRTQPNLSLIFLNHIAHLQHQFWHAGDALHPQMELGLRTADAVLGELSRNRRAGEAMLVMNCFRQRNVAGEGWRVYRQRAPERVVKALGVGPVRVEQSMTHDAHLLFADQASADAAMVRLQAVRLGDGTPVFHVEPAGEARLFYQLEIERAVPGDAVLQVGNQNIGFYELFELVCERTGAHLPEGDLYADGIAIPPSLPNHHVFDAIVGYLADPGSVRASAVA